MMARSLLRAFLFGAMSVLAVACASKHSDGSGTEIGMQPVHFRLERVGGGTDSLVEHRGHVVLLDLWASWCAPCTQELPDLSRLARSDPSIVVIAANQGESSDTAVQTVRKLQLRMPILLDRKQDYGNAYALVGLPTAVLLTKSGRIAAIETGSHSFEQWQAIVAKVKSQ